MFLNDETVHYRSFKGSKEQRDPMH